MLIWLYLKALCKHWWALMSCAIFTLLGMWIFYADKNNTWAIRALFAAAGLCLLLAGFRAWNDEHTRAKLLESQIDTSLLAGTTHPASSVTTNTVTPSITQEPKIDASQRVEIHNYPPIRTMPEAASVPPQIEAIHNVIFAGCSQVFSNLINDVSSSEEGWITIKACYLNKSIPDKRVANFDYARARVVFKNKSNLQVAEVNRAVWLGHFTTDTITIGVNSKECLLIAVFKDGWYIPHIVPRPSMYWEDGRHQLLIDAVALPMAEELSVEIDVVGEDNLGLSTATVRFELKPDGTVLFVSKQNRTQI